MRVQVIVAHPDDETFGCGSLVLLAKAAGATVAVGCATRGEAGEQADGPAGDGAGDLAGAPAGARLGADLGAVRAAELRAAADLMGVDRLDLLGYRDSGMSGEPAAGTLAAARPADVQAAVAGLVTSFAPDVLVTLDASDGHRDHSVIRDATLAVADALEVPRAYLLCLPRSLMRGWVEHVSASNPDAEHLDADTARLGTPDADITTVLDAADHLAVASRRSPCTRRSPRRTRGCRSRCTARSWSASTCAGCDRRGRAAPARPASSPEPQPSCTTSRKEAAMNAALHLPTRPGFGGAVGAPVRLLLTGHEHTTRCWWDPQQARWVCPRRPEPPS